MTFSGGKLNDVIYEPSSSSTSRKTAWYYYTDEAGKEQKKSYTFVTDATQAEKEYEHTLSNKVPYVATYTKGANITVTVNYTLDNRVYVYGTDNNKDIQESGCLVYFDQNSKMPRITIKNNPLDEKDIAVNTKISETTFFGSSIEPEMLTEQILYKNSAGKLELGTYIYIYDVTRTKYYYDGTKDKFFTLNSEREKIELSDDESIGARDTDQCKFKSVSILTSDSTYKKLYQVLNGRDKGKWYISLKEDPDRITEIGPGIEVIDTELSNSAYKYGL